MQTKLKSDSRWLLTFFLFPFVILSSILSSHELTRIIFRTRERRVFLFQIRSVYVHHSYQQISFHCSRKTALHLDRTFARTKATETPAMAILLCQRISRKITQVNVHTKNYLPRNILRISIPSEWNFSRRTFSEGTKDNLHRTPCMLSNKGFINDKSSVRGVSSPTFPSK